MGIKKSGLFVCSTKHVIQEACGVCFAEWWIIIQHFVCIYRNIPPTLSPFLLPFISLKGRCNKSHSKSSDIYIKEIRVEFNMNNERYDMQYIYMCGPVCKKCHGSVTSHVTHIYGHLVYLNGSVWILCLTNTAFRRDYLNLQNGKGLSIANWSCSNIINDFFMCTGFSRNCLLWVSFPFGVDICK